MRKPPNSDLKHQLEQSRRWYDTGTAEGSEAYLAFETHTGVDLTAAVLVSATLQETNLTQCALDDALLIDALANGLIARQCTLDRFNASSADLVEADFSDSRGSHTTFRKARLSRARFDRALLQHADFRSAVCLATSFRQCDLRSADFSNALLAAADLSLARLDQANLNGARLTGQTRFHDAQGLDSVNAAFLFLEDERVEGPAVAHLLRQLNQSSGVS